MRHSLFRRRRVTVSRASLEERRFASNIAEGEGHSSDKELLHFLNCARGSLYEVQTQLLIAKKLNYLESESSEQVILKAAELGRLLNGLIRAFHKATAA